MTADDTGTGCPSCEGTGKIRTGGLGPFALKMRVLHINGNDTKAVNSEGPKCKTCGGTGRVTGDRPESTGFTCMGCGATAVGELWLNGEWHKPAHWYSRSDADGDQLACSRACIGKVAAATGKSKAVMPW